MVCRQFNELKDKTNFKITAISSFSTIALIFYLKSDHILMQIEWIRGPTKLLFQVRPNKAKDKKIKLAFGLSNECIKKNILGIFLRMSISPRATRFITVLRRRFRDHSEPPLFQSSGFYGNRLSFPLIGFAYHFNFCLLLMNQMIGACTKQSQKPILWNDRRRHQMPIIA